MFFLQLRNKKKCREGGGWERKGWDGRGARVSEVFLPRIQILITKKWGGMSEGGGGEGLVGGGLK